jgi:predicted HTH transcriptional regulator
MDNNIIKKDNQAEKINEIMNKIESDTVKKISELINDSSESSSSVVCNIMKIGANEFIEKTGRNMTYSEIRQMFG